MAAVSSLLLRARACKTVVRRSTIRLAVSTTDYTAHVLATMSVSILNRKIFTAKFCVPMSARMLLSTLRHSALVNRGHRRHHDLKLRMSYRHSDNQFVRNTTKSSYQLTQTKKSRMYNKKRRSTVSTKLLHDSFFNSSSTRTIGKN